jgi:hypothetical protein
MIRLRWPAAEGIDPSAAPHLDHPRLVRLRGTGLWTFTGACMATMQVEGWQAASWSAWEPGLDGCEFSIAANPLPVERLDPERIPSDAEQITLACGERVWILPARRAPRRLGLHGEDRGPADAYGAAAFALSDAMDAKRHTREEVLRVCFLALASVNRRLIPELVIGWGLLGSTDIQPILEAAWRIPKAQAGGATSSSEPPPATPPAAKTA